MLFVGLIKLLKPVIAALIVSAVMIIGVAMGLSIWLVCEHFGVNYGFSSFAGVMSGLSTIMAGMIAFVNLY